MNDLEAGKRMNGFSHIFTNHFALGSQEESQRIFFEDESLCSGTASFVESGDSGKASELVFIKTIDSIVDSVKTPDFIKIDVEGFQAQVIKGAKTFFERRSPMIMMEVDEHTEQWLENYFSNLGYSFYRFNKRSLTKVDSIFHSGRNVFMLKSNSKYEDRISKFVNE